MANNYAPSFLLMALAILILPFFIPKILSFLLKRQKQRIRSVAGEYIAHYPHKLFTYEVPIRNKVSKRKIKKIRKHIEPRLQGEIFFLKPSFEKGETNKLSFSLDKMFYFTHEQDIDIFTKSVNKFLKYELKKVV